MTSFPNNMIAQVYSIAELIRDEFDTLNERVINLLPDNQLAQIERVIITGCGDSHMSGIATEMAFEQIARVPCEPFTALQGGRYAAPYIVPNTLVCGISVSGTVARTREALLQFGRFGATTIAVTANPESPLGQTTSNILDCTIPDYPPAPGVRSYRVSLLMLWLLAIRLGEVKGALSAEEAQAARMDLRATADACEATFDANHDRTLELAKAMRNEKSFVFMGHGPNYATALFSAAKLIEAAGNHAMGQDTEEWAHLQYFTIMDRTMPTFVISADERGHSRSAELIEPLNRLGRQIVAIVPDYDKEIAPHMKWVLPLVGAVREVFTPMVAAIPGELFAAHMADVTGNTFFRRPHEGENAGYAQGNTIRTSTVVEDIQP